MGHPLPHALARPGPAAPHRRDLRHRPISEAEREAWLGEIEGLKTSLADATDNLAQIDRRANRQPVNLGFPATQPTREPENKIPASP